MWVAMEDRDAVRKAEVSWVKLRYGVVAREEREKTA